MFNVADGVVPSDWDIVVATEDGTIKKLVDGGSDPRYLSSGKLVFARHGSLWAAALDLDRLELAGPAVKVVEDVMHAQRATRLELNSGVAQYSASSNGTLAIVSGGPYPAYDQTLAWLNEDGGIEPLPLEHQLLNFPRVSPLGDRLAYTVGGFGEAQIWTFDVGSGVPVQMTSEGHNVAPIWRGDGKQIAFAHVALDSEAHGGVYVMAADGSEKPRRIAPGHHPVTASWSVDDVIAFVDGESESIETIWTVRADGGSEAQRFLPEGEVGAYAEFSPDGRWLAYAALERDEEFVVYVRPYPAGAPRVRISPGSGYAPMWSRDGRRLFYLTPFSNSSTLMAVAIEADLTLRAGKPEPLYSAPWGRYHPVRAYDFSPDGTRVVFPTSPSPLPPQPVTKIDIVLNWGSELAQLVQAD